MLICPLADENCKKICPHRVVHTFLFSCKPASKCGTKETSVACVDWLENHIFDVWNENYVNL